MPKVGSPNLDIAYLIFASGRPDTRKRWKELLQVYFDALKNVIQDLGHGFPFAFEVRSVFISGMTN